MSIWTHSLGREKSAQQISAEEEVAPGSHHLQKLTVARVPQVRIALHLGAEVLIRLILLHTPFDVAQALDLKLEHDAIKIAGHIRQYPCIRNLRGCHRFFQLRRELARIAWLRDKTISYDDHDLLLGDYLTPLRFLALNLPQSEPPTVSERPSASPEG
jgi:hypothetical protein